MAFILIMVAIAAIALIGNITAFVFKQMAVKESLKADRIKFSQQQELQALKDQIKDLKSLVALQQQAQAQAQKTSSFDDDEEVKAARKEALIAKLKLEKFNADNQRKLSRTKKNVIKVAP